MIKTIWATLIISLLLLGCGSDEATEENNVIPPAVDLSALGRLIFFDTNLSTPAGQSCSSCHDPDAGFADPDINSPTSEGVNAGLFGNRNTPTSAYAFLSPDFVSFIQVDDPDNPGQFLYQGSLGGQFLDGRRDDLVGQAKDPFLNPVEMANADAAAVVNKVSNASYADMFRQAFGQNAFDNVNTAYNNIAIAIAEFEESAEMNPFTSKFDYYQQGLIDLTAEELRGLDIFMVKGKCNTCHFIGESLPLPTSPPAAFTDFRYFNIGVPANPNNPFYAQEPGFIDQGLGGVSDDRNEDGMFKTPTLRNIELTAPYMHNGVFATLEEVVDFYNTPLDVLPEPPPPEIDPGNISIEVGALDLTDPEKADLVAFMKTLTDGFPAP